MINRIKRKLADLVFRQVPEFQHYKSISVKVDLGKSVKLYHPVRMFNVSVGDYSYVGMYSHLKNVTVGKFCSIGPNCFFGWGIHPIDGISTSPMFYSLSKQNGSTLSRTNKVIEEKPITIGNDVFIGMNVTILDGVTIGNGAVIGAGAVVSKDIPAYAVAIGNPIRIIKYRFSNDIISELLKLQWWDFNDDDLEMIEENFFDISEFIKKAKERRHGS